MVDLLLGAGAAPLPIAATSGTTEVAARLLAHMADAGADDAIGWTPVDLPAMGVTVT